MQFPSGEGPSLMGSETGDAGSAAVGAGPAAVAGAEGAPPA